MIICMDRNVAHLLIRQHLALTDEGIGPRDATPADNALLNRAVHAAGDDFDSHDLYEARLIGKNEHRTARPSCPNC